jgi:hypothetical protein
MPSFTIYYCIRNKMEMKMKKKIVGLGFREAGIAFRV